MIFTWTNISKKMLFIFSLDGYFLTKKHFILLDIAVAIFLSSFFYFFRFFRFPLRLHLPHPVLPIPLFSSTAYFFSDSPLR